MSMRNLEVQYIGDALYLPPLEREVRHIIERDVEQVSERLRAFGWEEVVRCRDCTAYDGEGYGCSYGRGDDPDGFCAWGESAWVTCKCGEDIERHDRIQVCPSCGRKVMA